MSLARGYGRAISAILLVFALDSFGAEEGGGWTNVAGHVLHATPQAIEGQTVVFVQDGTRHTVEYPLSAFPPQEQERLRSRLKKTTIPEGLRSAYEYSARMLHRYHLLYGNGQMSEKAYWKSIEATLSALRQQAAPLVEQNRLSKERLELILRELVTATDRPFPADGILPLSPTPPGSYKEGDHKTPFRSSSFLEKRPTGSN